MYDRNPGGIDFRSSQREVRVVGSQLYFHPYCQIDLMKVSYRKQLQRDDIKKTYFDYLVTIPFAVNYKKIRSLLRETATNSAKIHSLAQKYEHLPINQIQLRCLHFNQYSITLLGIHMRHWATKREKYTFIKANIKVINTILKVNRDN